MKQDGEVAKNLSEICGCAKRHVQDINMSNEKVAAEDVIAVLVPLSRSWNELADRDEEMPMAMPKAPSQPRRPLTQPGFWRTGFSRTIITAKQRTAAE